MTAVEFQTEQIGILVSKLFNDEISKAEFHFTRFEICEKAKEMEKQQIIDAYNIGFIYQIDINFDTQKSVTGEEYYEQRFNK